MGGISCNDRSTFGEILRVISHQHLCLYLRPFYSPYCHWFWWTNVPTSLCCYFTDFSFDREISRVSQEGLLPIISFILWSLSLDFHSLLTSLTLHEICLSGSSLTSEKSSPENFDLNIWVSLMNLFAVTFSEPHNVQHQLCRLTSLKDFIKLFFNFFILLHSILIHSIISLHLTIEVISNNLKWTSQSLSWLYFPISWVHFQICIM